MADIRTWWLFCEVSMQSCTLNLVPNCFQICGFRERSGASLTLQASSFGIHLSSQTLSVLLLSFLSLTFCSPPSQTWLNTDREPTEAWRRFLLITVYLQSDNQEQSSSPTLRFAGWFCCSISSLLDFDLINVQYFTFYSIKVSTNQPKTKNMMQIFS